MAKPIVIHDPYRNIDTTLAEFAKAEGVPKYTVSHYYWVHRSLDRFRERPAKGTGNGIKPHTYTRNGEFITMQEAQRVSGMNESTMKKFREKYGTNDIDEIKRHREAELEQIRQARLKVMEDGRMMTLTEYAKEQGVTLSAVTSWLYRKGTLKGFKNRGASRVHPTLYRHSGMGLSKTKKGWAQYFKCSVPLIKTWLKNHGRDLIGFEKRRVTISVTYKGKKISKWASKFGVSYSRVYNYYRNHNRSLKGFDPTRKQGRPLKVA